MAPPVKAFPGLPGAAVFAVSLLLLALVAWADVVTSYELTLSILYLAPVFLATWTRGLRLGMTVAILCGVVWSITEAINGHTYSDPFFRYWEGMIKMATFVKIGRAHV